MTQPRTRAAYLGDLGDYRNARGPAGSPFTAVGEASSNRQNLKTSANPLSSGFVELSYFMATKTETITSLKLFTTATAAATITLLKYCAYNVADNGDLTLAASTESDTTLLAAANTEYPKSLLAPWAKVVGRRYAVGLLVVGTTMPTLISFDMNSATTFDSIYAAEPRLSGRLTGQTDLPATIPAGSVSASRRAPYVEMR